MANSEALKKLIEKWIPEEDRSFSEDLLEDGQIEAVEREISDAIGVALGEEKIDQKAADAARAELAAALKPSATAPSHDLVGTDPNE